MPKPGTNNEAMRAQTAARRATNENGKDYWYTYNTVLPNEQNKISQATVQDQLARAPAPQETGKSGYPHEYFNQDEDKDKQPLFRTRTNSSTKTYHEYPVMASGKTYAFDKKPRANPGPFRAIVNQNKTFKGVIAHDGEGTKPNAGRFHRATEHRP